LAEALVEADVLDVLTRQLVRMGQIAWQKHLVLRAGRSISVVGAVVVAIAAWLKS
jgi:hypothetical protein